MALCMMASLPSIRERVLVELGVKDAEIDLRIGLHSGPVAAGIVGIKNPRYVVFAHESVSNSTMKAHYVCCLGTSSSETQ